MLLALAALIVLTLDGHAEDRSASAVFDEALRLLKATSYRDVTLLMHEPQGWSRENVERDRAEMTTAMHTVIDHLGAVKSAAPSRGELVGLYLGVGPGDLPYWASLPRGGVDATSAFDATFAEAGAGTITLRATKVSGAWELHSIIFGVPTKSKAGASVLTEAAVALVHQAQPGLSDQEARRLAVQMLSRPP